MSSIIQLLPDHVANQIAAGEVVQRPASVVKELLENAIDAGATQVQVLIKNAGRTLIQITDNGKGMSVTDARMAFERHATSKIRTTDDIFKIKTNGFRGEALASIAAVAQVELKTKQATDDVGTSIHIHGGEIKEQEAAVTTTGTTISVKNLFYNVPARRNFLKSNSVEFRHILDEFHRVALSYEEVGFTLTHNNEEVFRLNPTHLAQRILHVFGKKLEGKLLNLSEETELVKISGFIGKPELARKSRGEQFFFVNHRFIKSNYLHRALLNAYESLIPKGMHPSYFIFLEIPPERIDINIHPTKTEIKFEDDYAVFAQLRAAARHALGQHQVTPTLNFDKEEDWDVPILDKKRPVSLPEIEVDSTYNPFETEKESPFSQKSKIHYSPPSAPPSRGGDYQYYEIEKESEQQQVIEIESSLHMTPNAMQWNNAYLVVEYKGDLLLIDQHRAHQSVLFEKFNKRSQERKLSQQLLFPIELPLDEKEKIALQSSLDEWLRFGFDIKITDHTGIIAAVPAELPNDMITPLMHDFFAHTEEIDLAELRKEIAKLMSKSAAIKKGKKLTEIEAQSLIQDFMSLEEWVYSPFGKKNYKTIRLQDLQKYLD